MAWSLTGNIRGPAGAAGTSWSAGAWQNLTLGTSIATATGGYSTPSARLEGTDVVRIRGRISASAAVAIGATIATLPVGLRPTVVRALGVRASAGALDMLIATTGVVTLSAGIASASTVDLDGLSFTL